MDMTPQDIVGTTFRVVRKGFDPDEVRAFQADAAHALETAQSLASLMEQRARAAVAKAQGLAAASEAAPAAASAPVAMHSDDAETISRTLLLAQRTAERAIAEAAQEASSIRAAAQADGERTLADARAEAEALLTGARVDARRAGEAERVRVMAEVQALLARLDFLREDVHEMEAFAAAQRQQLAAAAVALQSVADSQVGAVSDLRRPVLSPAADMVRTVAEPPPAPVAAAPVVVPEPVVAPPVEAPPPLAPAAKVVTIKPDDATPGVGSPLLPPLELGFDEVPTGEVPVVRATSGPVAVPDLDDWAEDPSVRIRLVRQNDLHFVDED